MAKREIDATAFHTKTGRKALPVDTSNPYWLALSPGQLFLGYRKRRKDSAGKWVRRIYIGKNDRQSSPYESEDIGLADDFEEADGVSVLSFTQARAKALDGHTKQEKARKAGITTGPYTIADVIADYAKTKTKLGRSRNDPRLAVHILPKLGHIKASDLTTVQLNNWQEELKTQPARVRSAPGREQRYRPTPLSPSTVRRVRTMLLAALNAAFTESRIADDAAWRRMKKLGDVDKAREGCLSYEQVPRLINACDTDFRQVVRAALYTGCRYEELCSLQVRDFNKGLILIRKSKSGKSRYVRLQPDAIAFLTQLCAGRPSGETMLLRRDGQAWGANHQSRRMADACKRANIEPPVGMHELRHTWATHAVEGGMPLYLVAENLGHADLRLVLKNYSHVGDKHKADLFAAHAPQFGVVEETNIVPLKKGA